MVKRPQRGGKTAAKRPAGKASEDAAMPVAPPSWQEHDDGRRRWGYARASMDDQTNAVQIAALVGAGVRPRDIFTDAASGNMERPGWEACWKGMREGDTLVVQGIDRLGRSLGQLALTLEALHAKGADLLVTEPEMDFRTTAGRFAFEQLARFAEFERVYINERTMDGLRRAKERGRIGGQKAMHSHQKILDWYQRLGGTHGAKAARMSKSGFLKAVARARKTLEEKEIVSARPQS